MIYGIIYIIGIFISFLLWSMFGKKYWIDYDPPHDDDYDDWDSNKQAYTTFSLAWPLFFIFVVLAAIWKGLTFIMNFFLKTFNHNESKGKQIFNENDPYGEELWEE